MKIKVLPQRHRVENPQLRSQSSEDKTRTLGTFGSSRLHSQGLRKLCSSGTTGTNHSCQGAIGSCSLWGEGAVQPDSAVQHVEPLCHSKTFQTGTQVFSASAELASSVKLSALDHFVRLGKNCICTCIF